jgi:hypothetical protein
MFGCRTAQGLVRAPAEGSACGVNSVLLATSGESTPEQGIDATLPTTPPGVGVASV